VRLLAATNDDLPRLAKAGKFRNDLLDRLAFDVLTLPPLRDRETDIQLLADHFAVNMANELEREYFPGFTNAARIALAEYPWPGNIRELKNVVERCVYRCEPDDEVDEIVFDPFESPFRPQESARTEEPVANPGVDHTLPLDLKQTVQAFEIELINQAMQEGKHNQRKAAELLKLTYHQLRGYLKKYELLKSE
jgi:psp operon transcriptional activator